MFKSFIIIILNLICLSLYSQRDIYQFTKTDKEIKKLKKSELIFYIQDFYHLSDSLISSQNSKIENLENNIENNKIQISQLNIKVSELNDKIRVDSQNIQFLNDSLNSLIYSIKTLNKKVDSLNNIKFINENKLKQLKKSINQINSNLYSKYDTEIRLMKDSIHIMNSEIRKYELLDNFITNSGNTTNKIDTNNVIDVSKLTIKKNQYFYNGKPYTGFIYRIGQGKEYSMNIPYHIYPHFEYFGTIKDGIKDGIWINRVGDWRSVSPTEIITMYKTGKLINGFRIKSYIDNYSTNNFFGLLGLSFYHNIFGIRMVDVYGSSGSKLKEQPKFVSHNINSYQLKNKFINESIEVQKKICEFLNNNSDIDNFLENYRNILNPYLNVVSTYKKEYNTGGFNYGIEYLNFKDGKKSGKYFYFKKHTNMGGDITLIHGYYNNDKKNNNWSTTLFKEEDISFKMTLPNFIDPIKETQLHVVSNFKNDKLDGDYLMYQNGLLVERTKYDDGKVSNQYEVYENGMIKFVRKYKSGFLYENIIYNSGIIIEKHYIKTIITNYNKYESSIFKREIIKNNNIIETWYFNKSTIYDYTKPEFDYVYFLTNIQDGYNRPPKFRSNQKDLDFNKYDTYKITKH